MAVEEKALHLETVNKCVSVVRQTQLHISYNMPSLESSLETTDSEPKILHQKKLCRD